MSGGGELLQEESLPKIQETPCRDESTGTVSEENVTFTINEEDHTLGNVLRFVLAKYPETDFVGGLQLPHLHITVQIYDSSSDTTPYYLKSAGKAGSQSQRPPVAGIERLKTHFPEHERHLC
ncbi:uncharacterized protein LOC142358624 isoform X2 [Convolutriloba macropyga]|uniref:uncharacterized protein LOC142358624 isoform X2 n=1 Tax=Convolutriloba macropyga TaxID=536237 RepID=UPI003F51CC52